LSSAVQSDPGVATSANAGEVPKPAAAAPVRSRWWVEVLVLGWLLWVYDAITNLAPLRMSAALDHARGIHNLELSLGIAPEHSLDTWLAAHRSLALALSDYYDNAHFIVTIGLLGWLWWARADIYRGLRNSLVLINVIAFIVFWRYPVAPPRMLAGFTDVVASTGAIGSWHSGALAHDANQFAAMPSLHIAWAVWCSVAIWRATRRAWIRALGIVYPFVTAFAVLATGNHFVLDILGGLVVAAVSFAIVGLVSRRRAAPAAVPA
jgi:PAP2 superfamily